MTRSKRIRSAVARRIGRFLGIGDLAESVGTLQRRLQSIESLRLSAFSPSAPSSQVDLSDGASPGTRSAPVDHQRSVVMPERPTPGETYAGYGTEDLWVFELFSGVHPEAQPGFVVDFLGTRTRTTSLWDSVRNLDGTVMDVPVPHDLFEAVEWVGLLKAVASAGVGRFAMMELGAGLAPWLVAGAKAAGLRGIQDIRLLGVEADPGRFELMRQHFLDNDLDPASHELICGAVGAKKGRARWPRIADPANAAGARPVKKLKLGVDPDDSAYMHGAMEASIDVEILAFEDLLARQAVWDLVHIDVQGWEAQLCAAAAGTLSDRVRWMVIGTHSRLIEGQLLATLHGMGWVLENEKPTRFKFEDGQSSVEAMTDVDGVQVWRNPRLEA